MIDIETALSKVVASNIKMDIVELEISDTLNYFLAEDVVSPINLPPFSQSAMDGYAICGDGEVFRVIGEIKAGDTHSFVLNKGEAYRIFTGAMIPQNTTSIAKQEIVERVENNIKLTESVKIGMSIRHEGEELKKGEVVLKKGTSINASAIGLLAGVGLSKLKVLRKPKISVIVTGSELTKLGKELQKGKIYESNSYTIQSVLLENGFESDVQWVEDNYENTITTIEKAMNNSDVVIITGGISVGDYDFVGKALSELDVKEVFYKVNQKPGKPIYYGETDNVKVFGLPGNPAAALTCFYVYVLTALKTMMGSQKPELVKSRATIKHNYLKKGDRAHLLKGKWENNHVEVHKGQSSAMLSSYVDANCLIYIEASKKQVLVGDDVDIFLLP